MSLRINETIPDLTVETDQGSLSLHSWIADDWAILFSHPKDFTPVCTTEFGAVAKLSAEWKKRGTKVIGVSVDSAEDHRNWKADIEKVGGAVEEFAVGDEVYYMPELLQGSGSYAQYRCIAAEHCLVLPDGTTPQDAASCFVNPLTALGMVETMRLEGHTALVHRT